MDTPIRILCVDDDALLLSSLRRLLVRAGFEVETSDSGAAALTRLASWVPHILVSDLQMPEMGGQELLAQVRVRYPAIRRVLLTGSSLAGTEAETGQGAICELMLRKPFDASIVEYLVALVERP